MGIADQNKTERCAERLTDICLLSVKLFNYPPKKNIVACVNNGLNYLNCINKKN